MALRICCLIVCVVCTLRVSGARGVSPVHIVWRQSGGRAGTPGSPRSRASGLRDRLANCLQHSIHLWGRPDGDPHTSFAARIC